MAYRLFTGDTESGATNFSDESYHILDSKVDQDGHVIALVYNEVLPGYIVARGLVHEKLNGIRWVLGEYYNNLEDAVRVFFYGAKGDHSNGICPKCENDELSYGDSEILDESYSYKWECSKCGASGEETHALVFVEHFLK